MPVCLSILPFCLSLLFSSLPWSSVFFFFFFLSFLCCLGCVSLSHLPFFSFISLLPSILSTSLSSFAFFLSSLLDFYSSSAPPLFFFFFLGAFFNSLLVLLNSSSFSLSLSVCLVSLLSLGILDVLQIFGRAGRPQFDSRGSAVLMTCGAARLSRYLRLLTNNMPVASRFLGHLPNALNAEIAMGSVSSVSEAVDWLRYTFLFVRMYRYADKQKPLRTEILRDRDREDTQLKHK